MARVSASEHVSERVGVGTRVCCVWRSRGAGDGGGEGLQGGGGFGDLGCFGVAAFGLLLPCECFGCGDGLAFGFFALAARLADSGTRRIVLGHLSRENNSPQRALDTVHLGLSGRNVQLMCAPVSGCMELQVEEVLTCLR